MHSRAIIKELVQVRHIAATVCDESYVCAVAQREKAVRRCAARSMTLWGELRPSELQPCTTCETKRQTVPASNTPATAIGAAFRCGIRPPSLVTSSLQVCAWHSDSKMHCTIGGLVAATTCSLCPTLRAHVAVTVECVHQFRPARANKSGGKVQAAVSEGASRIAMLESFTSTFPLPQLPSPPLPRLPVARNEHSGASRQAASCRSSCRR